MLQTELFSKAEVVVRPKQKDIDDVLNILSIQKGRALAWRYPRRQSKEDAIHSIKTYINRLLKDGPFECKIRRYKVEIVADKIRVTRTR